VHRDPALPTATVGEPPSKSRNSSPFAEGRKEVICTTTRTPQGITFPAYPSLRNIAESSGEKNSKHKLQGHKGLQH
jgi:hypothetical protein